MRHGNGRRGVSRKSMTRTREVEFPSRDRGPRRNPVRDEREHQLMENGGRAAPPYRCLSRPLRRRCPGARDAPRRGPRMIIRAIFARTPGPHGSRGRRATPSPRGRHYGRRNARRRKRRLPRRRSGRGENAARARARTAK